MTGAPRWWWIRPATTRTGSGSPSTVARREPSPSSPWALTHRPTHRPTCRMKGNPMPIALTDEHEAQRLSARRWLDAHCPSSVPRALLDAAVERLQPVWKESAAQGWLGIHLPEEFGGQGFGLFELAVILEETGWSVLPGPLLPTVVTSALVAEAMEPAAAGRILPGVIDGSVTAALSLGDTHLDVVGGETTGELVVSGTLRPLLGAATASVVLAPARHPDGTETWCLIDVPGPEG